MCCILGMWSLWHYSAASGIPVVLDNGHSASFTEGFYLIWGIKDSEGWMLGGCARSRVWSLSELMDLCVIWAWMCLGRLVFEGECREIFCDVFSVRCGCICKVSWWVCMLWCRLKLVFISNILLYCIYKGNMLSNLAFCFSQNSTVLVLAWRVYSHGLGSPRWLATWCVQDTGHWHKNLTIWQFLVIQEHLDISWACKKTYCGHTFIYMCYGFIILGWCDTVLLKLNVYIAIQPITPLFPYTLLNFLKPGLLLTLWWIKL